MRFTLAEVAAELQCLPEHVLTGLCGSEAFFSPEKRGADAWAAAPWAGTVLLGADSDNRRIQPGEAFFCLVGERVDGHDFAVQAVEAGAVAVVASRNPFGGMDSKEAVAKGLPPVFLVPDVKVALEKLAIAYRNRVGAKIIGVTGSAGKTSVKEVLAQVLSVKAETAKNYKNLNSQIGLPISILRASPTAAFWVLEAGISQPHDMDELGAMLRPDVALVLNVGSAHVEGLGDKGVGYYKSRLLKYVQPSGAAFVSLDYPALTEQVEELAPELKAKGIDVRTFSVERADADCFAAYAGAAEDPAKGVYTVHLRGKEHSLVAPFKGAYGAENIAAVYGIATYLGLSHAEIAAGFAAAALPEQRFACIQRRHYTLIDDSYNANPLSTRRMLETATLMAKESDLPLTLVMGEMRELGPEAEAAHTQLGKEMATTGTRLIFWKGDQQAYVRAGLAAAGYQGDFFPVGGGQEFSGLLEELTIPHGFILFKGSRSIQLERLRDIVLDLVCETEENNAV